MNYTPNYGLPNPVPGDPTQTDAWGTTENTGRSLVDTALGGSFALSVAGTGITALTSTPGVPDQSRYAHYVLSGILTGNRTILWPNGSGRMFSVKNNTTGAFSLSAGADNGAGGLAGTAVAIPQGSTYMLASDGTNVSIRQSGPLGTLLAANNLSDVANAASSRANLTAAKSGANSDITSLTGLSTPLSAAQGGTGNTSLAATYAAMGGKNEGQVNYTLSAAGPSGGANEGDIWDQYV